MFFSLESMSGVVRGRDIVGHRAESGSAFALAVISTGGQYRMSDMGSKDKGKKEVKKAPKPKPKPEPGRKREGFTPAPPK
jgi:hypothetical protein